MKLDTRDPWIAGKVWATAVVVALVLGRVDVTLPWAPDMHEEVVTPSTSEIVRPYDEAYPRWPAVGVDEPEREASDVVPSTDAVTGIRLPDEPGLPPPDRQFDDSAAPTDPPRRPIVPAIVPDTGPTTDPGAVVDRQAAGPGQDTNLPPKPDTPRPEPTPAPKPETKPVAPRPEPQPEPVEPKPELKPEVDAKPDPRPRPEPQPEPKPEPESKPEDKPEPEPKPEDKPRPEPKPEPKPEPEDKAKPEPKQEDKPKHKPKPKPEPKPEAEPEPVDAELQAEAGSEDTAER